jgi:hypothetical protein
MSRWPPLTFALGGGHELDLRACARGANVGEVKARWLDSGVYQISLRRGLFLAV